MRLFDINVRLIQAMIPSGKLPDVQRALDERDIDYFATHETGTDEYSAVVYISVPEEAVESVFTSLYDTGLDSDDYVLLIDTEVDIFGRADGVRGYVAVGRLRNRPIPDRGPDPTHPRTGRGECETARRATH